MHVRRADLGSCGHQSHGVGEVRSQLRDAHVLVVDAPDEVRTAIIILQQANTPSSQVAEYFLAHT